ncbi:MAG: DUF1365 domain-containing protein [Silicimonas sp.]|nr:DUF1365 domain-containing protein [Silicimonas sp.]
MLDHIQAYTTHARRGQLRNAFRYGVDYVLSELSDDNLPALMSRNGFNLWSLSDRKHGGERGQGRGLKWFKNTLRSKGFDPDGAQLVLLTQPSFLWFHFNPVSFWIALRDDQPCAFIAEVNNTFGDRHCYFCAHEDFRPITVNDRLRSEKLMHVSPFQAVEGVYTFNFGLTKSAINIRIDYRNGDEGVLATLAGPRLPATSASLLKAAFRRPLGAMRVVALIHWQAVILYLKRAPFFKTPEPPGPLVSDSLTFQGKDL